MLRATWHVIGGLVHKLYQGCLSIGYHPKAFREAEVVMLAKPGRRDLSSPRAWRPISLLSCLGKGLERLIARRLAWASVHFGVLHPQQFGVLPKRSAVDLVAALVHDIEEAFTRKQVATLVTLDIQGAFDTVLRNKLVLRLREQGWPPNLAHWVGSFMQGRSARVRLPRHRDGIIAPPVRPATRIASLVDSLPIVYGTNLSPRRSKRSFWLRG